MKFILSLVFSLISFYAFSQQTDYAEWQEEAKHNINMLPEYGQVKKTEEQVQADNDFIKIALTQEGTARKASEHLVKLGFKYLYNGDLKTAMLRFNQAWLLDNSNENAYWGFGAIYFTFMDAENAIKCFDKGLAINPASSVILTDKATVYFVTYQKESQPDESKLSKAIDLLSKSFKIDPANQNTLLKLSISYFLKKDCSNARKYYDACIKLGGRQISQEYSTALMTQCGK